MQQPSMRRAQLVRLLISQQLKGTWAVTSVGPQHNVEPFAANAQPPFQICIYDKLIKGQFRQTDISPSLSINRLRPTVKGPNNKVKAERPTLNSLF